MPRDWLFGPFFMTMGPIRAVAVFGAVGASDDPDAWLADALARIEEYKNNKVDELLLWRRGR